jgi:hypothetical protein
MIPYEKEFSVVMQIYTRIYLAELSGEGGKHSTGREMSSIQAHATIFRVIPSSSWAYLGHTSQADISTAMMLALVVFLRLDSGGVSEFVASPG